MDACLAAAERRIKFDKSDAAAAEFITAWLRAGRRDPRRCPRAGDLVIVGRDQRLVMAPEFDDPDCSWPGMRFVAWTRPGEEPSPGLSVLDVTIAVMRSQPVRVPGQMHLSSWRRWARRGRVVALSTKAS